MIAVLLLALAGTPLVQVADPCASQTAVSTVTSGAPFTLTWLEPLTVAASSTDATPVQNRINGFSVQIDGGAKVEVPASSMGTCSSGPFAGMAIYSYRTLSGVAKGNHTAMVVAWNFALDANGNPTTNRQESAAVPVPFVAADLALSGAPPPPSNVIIKK